MFFGRLSMSQSEIVVRSPAELGELVRSQRKAQGQQLSSIAPKAGVGTRFLSEFERGKKTVELGKVFDSLHALNLDLAIVPMASHKYCTVVSGYSKLLDTEFPYDWSNRQMPALQFIHKVLQAHRFNDVMRIIKYFGFDDVSGEVLKITDVNLSAKLVSMLARIQKGMFIAKMSKANVAS